MIDRGVRPTAWRRRAVVTATAVLTALSMGATELLVTGPATRHPAVVATWYEQHASTLEWRGLFLALSAVAVVAFAMTFRELTWSVVPDRLWAGTVMVLAALGYAALTSVAAAIDLAIVHQLPGLDPDVMALGASTRTALLAVATPAIVVVLFGTAPPLIRASFAGQAVTVAAGAVTLLLVLPATWQLGRLALPGWFLLVGTVVLWPGFARARASVSGAEPPRSRTSLGSDDEPGERSSAGD